MLHAANLGDSGFMVIRGDQVVYKSPAQQHSFNFPFQLGRGGPGVFDPPIVANVSTASLTLTGQQARLVHPERLPFASSPQS